MLRDSPEKVAKPLRVEVQARLGVEAAAQGLARGLEQARRQAGEGHGGDALPVAAAGGEEVGHFQGDADVWTCHFCFMCFGEDLSIVYNWEENERESINQRAAQQSCETSQIKKLEGG